MNSSDLIQLKFDAARLLIARIAAAIVVAIACLTRDRMLAVMLLAVAYKLARWHPSPPPGMRID